MINPTTVEFLASPDHDTLNQTVPVLSRYDVEIYRGNSLVKVQPLGKPTPDTNTRIVYDQFGAMLASVPAGDYVVKVSAVGPGGKARSANSDPFTVMASVPIPRPPGIPAVRMCEADLCWQDRNQLQIGINALVPFGWGATSAGSYVTNPYMNGGNDATVMPDARLTVIKNAGFDFMRLGIDPATLLAADRVSYTTTTVLDNLIAQIITGVGRRTALGLKVIIDLHFQSGEAVVAGWENSSLFDGVSGPKWTRVRFCVARLAAAVHAATRITCRPSQVCVELFNEPLPPGSPSTATYITHIRALWADVRAAMPLHTIVVGGNSFNAIDSIPSGVSPAGLTALTASHYDANTGFAFHPYESPIFTHQGVMGSPFQYMHGLTFPAASHVGGQSAAEAAFITAANTEGDHDGVAASNAVNACVTQTTWSTSLSRYFSAYGSKAALASRLAVATSWATAGGISHKRLFNTEFGVNFASTDDATDVSAAAFIKATRDISSEAGINCITVHVVQGSHFGIQNPTSPWAFNSAILAALF